MDTDKRLEQYQNDCDNLRNTDFNNFEELEKAYCRLINEGGQIRAYIIQNPEVCDENSYKVLSNQVHDLNMLADKYKPLSNIIYLHRELFNKYDERVKQLIADKNYEQALNIYDQMFKFSGNYWYKKEIANILYVFFEKTDDALEIYKEIAPYMQNDYKYFWGLAELYSIKKEYFKSVSYMKKAMLMEKQGTEKTA